jgi:H+-transporting ATPase
MKNQDKQSDTKVAKKSLGAEFKELSSSPDGLSASEAAKRLEKYGANLLENKKQSSLLVFLGYFWGPIPWMIEVAAVLSAVVGHWVDMSIVLVLLVFNAVVGFWQEHQAANAVDLLRKQLALKARVKRDGKWKEIDAANLVPGDIIRLRLGDIIPADVILSEGDYLSVDQSGLTGESLPVDKKVEDIAYSSSIVKQGEMIALITATGASTYFGRTAKLVASAQSVSHFQKAVLTIGNYLIYLSLGLAAALLLTMLIRGESLFTLFQFTLILIVAAIPVAMPAVLSVTMAIGAVILAREKAILTKLESIEEMAGMDILCSDKTGTLTQNKLTLGDPVTFDAKDEGELILTAALASKAENQDAIDLAVINRLDDMGDTAKLEAYQPVKFVPFDPVHKRTEAVLQTQDNVSLTVTKGAPQVILELCNPPQDLVEKVTAKVQEFAEKGFRTIGVARRGSDEKWRFSGLLPLFDPPREDAASTIEDANKHGIAIKMVTGDNKAIAEQIAGRLGLGTNIRRVGSLLKDSSASGNTSRRAAAEIEAAEGFAEVFPEHKYQIVRALQSRDHIVGMTGDGVNDAPALKQANCGIAVSGATDAARAAAALVLTAPGLSVIVRAVETARAIFERMNSYAIYRITETIRIMFFVALAMMIYNFYPITTVMIILLALLNDLPILAIAYDNTLASRKPVRWNMRRVLTISTVLGLIGVLETFGLLIIAKQWLGLSEPQIQSLIYLKLAIAGHLTLFVARTREPFFRKPYPAPILLTAILGTQLIAALIVIFGWLVEPIPLEYVAFVWAYCLIWVFIEDWAKLKVYNHLNFRSKIHNKFLKRMKEPLHPNQL